MKTKKKVVNARSAKPQKTDSSPKEVVDEKFVDAKQTWEKLGIKYAKLEFDCGGDDMNNMEWSFHNDKGKKTHSKPITINESDWVKLVNYFQDAVFDNVEFYQDSGDMYLGEVGIVYITLTSNGKKFKYKKVSKAKIEKLVSWKSLEKLYNE
jgi:hypothetical protein